VQKGRQSEQGVQSAPPPPPLLAFEFALLLSRSLCEQSSSLNCPSAAQTLALLLALLTLVKTYRSGRPALSAGPMTGHFQASGLDTFGSSSIAGSSR
jgi:hypothetical protein